MRRDRWSVSTPDPLGQEFSDFVGWNTPNLRLEDRSRRLSRRAGARQPRRRLMVPGGRVDGIPDESDNARPRSC
jgi:hypothetical protein